MLLLPQPMLLRSGQIPAGTGWRFEPKLDGFRCLVCTHTRFRARSRRGWDMTSLLPELERTLPADVQLDGELVALDPAGHPDFHRLSRRMLHGDTLIPIKYVIFDVLAAEGLAVTRLRYAERRELLEALELEGPHSQIVATFDDGEALYRVVCERGLEGVVAKRETQPYRPGDRAWVKTKNRATARFAEELAGATRSASLSRSR